MACSCCRGAESISDDSRPGAARPGRPSGRREARCPRTTPPGMTVPMPQTSTRRSIGVVPTVPAARMRLAKQEVAQCDRTLPGAANLPGSAAARDPGGTSRPGTVPVPRCPPVDPQPAGETSARNVSVRRFLQIPPGALAATPPLRGARARREPRHPVPLLPRAKMTFSPGFRRGFDPPADAPQGPPPRPAGGAGYGPGAAGELCNHKG